MVICTVTLYLWLHMMKRIRLTELGAQSRQLHLSFQVSVQFFSTSIPICPHHQAPTCRRACYNIWRRVLEGYHSWEDMIGQHSQRKFDENISMHQYFVEALISRLSGSMAEHLIHSPESRFAFLCDLWNILDVPWMMWHKWIHVYFLDNYEFQPWRAESIDTAAQQGMAFMRAS